MNPLNPILAHPYRLAALMSLLAVNLICLALILRDRRDPFSARRRWASRILWLSIGGSVAVQYFGTPEWRRSRFVRDNPILLGSVVIGPLVGVATFVAILTRRRLEAAGRADRRAKRGDLVGAIAELQVVVNRGLAFLSEPTAAAGHGSGPADPWAAPASSGVGPTHRRRRLLAQQVNALGALETRRQGWESALAHFRQAERVDPTPPRYRVNQAVVLANLGQHNEALALVSRAVGELAPADPIQAIEVLTQAAALNLALGRLDHVAPLLDQADTAVLRVHLPAPLRRPLAQPLAELRARFAEAQTKAEAEAEAEASAPSVGTPGEGSAA